MRCKHCGTQIAGAGTSKCPNCDENPFEKKSEETFSPETIKGRKIIRQLEKIKSSRAA